MFASRTARAAAASRSTDVFAFGTLAWELLSSQLAWEGQTENSRALALARGESLSAAALLLETPNSIGALVARCMALERRDRPRMAEAMAVIEQAHENLLSGRFDVFLSYAWGAKAARKPLADEVYVALRAAGLSVWLDEAEMGLDLAASMSEGIAKSSVVVALVSPDYAASVNCLFELRSAVAAGKPLITCCVEPGFWRGWLTADGSGARAVPDDHELAGLARLSTHLFVDLGACARVNWASEAVAPAERRLLQAPEALPRLLRLLAESRAALKAEAEAAALRGQQLNQSLRAKAQAALEAATAVRAAAAARLAEVEALALRRIAEARRKAEAAKARHHAAAVELPLASEADSEEALELVVECQASLRSAKAEEKRSVDSEAQRVNEARAALAACARVREEALAGLAVSRREEGAP